jgi:hypothetical protein
METLAITEPELPNAYASGKTWLSYNDPSWIAKRHGLGADADRTVDVLAATLSAVARKATERP